MPILYVNGKRRGVRIRGRAMVSNPARRRARSGKRAQAMVRAARRAGANVKSGRRRASTLNFKSKKAYERWKVGLGKRYRGKARIAGGRAFRAHALKRPAQQGARRRYNNTPRSKQKMAKGSRKRSRAMKRYWARRRRSGKRGGLGRTIAPKRRRRRRASTPKRTRSRRRRHGATRKRSRRRARKTTRRRRRSRRLVLSHTPLRKGTMRDLMPGPHTVPLRKNPARRRRRRARRAYYTRRRRRTTRRAHRTRRRRGARRRSYRRYRRNPGGFIVDAIKQAIPVALAFAASRIIVNKIGPMLPVAALGTLQGPVMSAAALVLTHFATKKVAALARHRDELMIGATLSMVGSVVTAFVPSLGSMVGLSDYVQMGDYIAVGGAPPLNERITLSDYIAVGGDGVQEELGLEEELGVEEELGNVLLGGLPGPTSGGLMKQVPSQAFIQPVPARSFTKQIPAAGGQYDAAADIYSGIFSGKFGGG